MRKMLISFPKRMDKEEIIFERIPSKKNQKAMRHKWSNTPLNNGEEHQQTKPVSSVDISRNTNENRKKQSDLREADFEVQDNSAGVQTIYGGGCPEYNEM